MPTCAIIRDGASVRSLRKDPECPPRSRSVSNKRNKFVGATIKFKGETRRVIGCAKVGDDESFYATRKPGSTGTRYTPVKKRAVRDLKSRKVQQLGELVKGGDLDGARTR